jgi:hypothetical protein
LRNGADTQGPDELARFGRFCDALTLEDGRAMELEAFQRTMLLDHFAGSVETLILIPKKNGKSTLLGALALYHLISTPDASMSSAVTARSATAATRGVSGSSPPTWTPQTA